MKSSENLLDNARQQILELNAKELHNYIKEGNNPVLLDVRGLDEWERGRLKGAVHIPRGNLEIQVEAKLPNKSREVVIYCAGGVRSLLAGQTLKTLGYSRIISMDGGYSAWVDAGLPSENSEFQIEEDGSENLELLRIEIKHLEQVLAKKKERLEKVKKS